MVRASRLWNTRRLSISGMSPPGFGGPERGTSVAYGFGRTLQLAQVKGLDRCHHEGPSIIGFETLKNSGSLPIAFLRGVGLPDNVIEYLPSLLNTPIQLYHRRLYPLEGARQLSEKLRPAHARSAC